MGCDKKQSERQKQLIEFQSTHPCGVRPAAALPEAVASGFNPRTPVGCDRDLGNVNNAIEEFQSTHPCGVRQEIPLTELRSYSVSIHAPLWGAT